ncbi:leukotriene B4 receptor 1-like [Sparus aurata]|uniref:leukotriene B4 receptor 1-like n=1 Tax=Sparus aurata TaxID=8175 RepID=UPI0011C1A80A|nr:leukotriene B4 receptor 1-like [Sparus aurata]
MNHSTILKMAPEEFEGGTAIACVILGLAFLVGAPGNLLVIWTILRHVKQRSHTVVLILHLAAADLLVLITLPLWIYSLVHTWVFGDVLCQALVYIVNVCMYGSIFFITLMGVERFLAICHPFWMMRRMTKRIMNMCPVFLWLLAFLLGLPALLTRPSDESEEPELCFIRQYNSVTEQIILFCLEILGGFVIPFIIITICYCLVAAQLRRMSYSSKQKSMILVHAVVIAFTLCWLPYHVINTIDLVCGEECVSTDVVFSTGALACISSSVNPLLYAFFARNLRGSLEESRLVRLFQEIATQTNRLRELVVQQQTGQRAVDTQGELMSDSVRLNP